MSIGAHIVGACDMKAIAGAGGNGWDPNSFSSSLAQAYSSGAPVAQAPILHAACKPLMCWTLHAWALRQGSKAHACCART